MRVTTSVNLVSIVLVSATAAFLIYYCYYVSDFAPTKRQTTKLTEVKMARLISVDFEVFGRVQGKVQL